MLGNAEEKHQKIVINFFLNNWGLHHSEIYPEHYEVKVRFSLIYDWLYI